MPVFHCEYIWLNFQIQKEYTLNVNEKGIIVDICSGAGNVELLPGLTIPGLVNTHCHLELSHLQGKIELGEGMTSFLGKIIELKKQIPYSAYAQKRAMEEMLRNGIVAVADVSNEGNSFILKKQFPNLYVHTFIELLGLNPQKVEQVIQRGIELLQLATAYYELSASLTPHAFYSVSIPLLQAIHRISDYMSIHLMESFAEQELFATRTGDFINFFSQLGLGEYVEDYRVGLIEKIIPQILDSNKKILWVHNTVLRPSQIQLLAEVFPKSYFCLCPLSNLYINQILPPAEIFDWDRVTLGTDSLA
ncbi:MAG: amidohydrolase family protein, partial [Bacteroidia bacterium]|nr:amidohydrolase family protein [Bacteroidia bacterium]MDW8159737.1 amidohydrolase family protein [Bacteroidia bacterium]